MLLITRRLSLQRFHFRQYTTTKTPRTPLHTSTQHKDKSVAVILSGCGFRDGSEIHEAVSVLIGISQAGAKYECFAPDTDQKCPARIRWLDPFLSHLPARIARGKIRSLDHLDPKNFDAVILPGGFGAALNLSNFATSSGEYDLFPKLEEILKAFHASKKPIGLCCISPVLAARIFPGCSVTVGSDTGTANRIQAAGANHIQKKVEEIHIDKDNLLVSTPAYMLQEPIHKVADGIIRMVDNVLQLSHDKSIFNPEKN